MHRKADALRHDAPRKDALRHDARPAVAPRSKSLPEAPPGTDAPPSPRFPGCRSFQLTRDAVDQYEGRFEYWDAATETVWVVAEPPSGAHEQPSRRLAALGEVIASLRGGPIECRGSMGLIWNAGQRERRRIMQADEVAYLYPARARIPARTGLVIGEHDLPDVVLEVDHTTDVRRGKLGLYAAWGFPEVWVEVPDVTSSSRPAGRAPGLTIHRLDAGRYRTVAASVAFPGWTAAEIHVAFNEPVRSAATARALKRVARALGTRDGTGPKDTLWLREERDEEGRERHEQGIAEGHKRGIAEGREQGLAEARAGERARLCRQAARKFDDATARRLATLLADAADPERLAQVGDWIIDCATGAELLARVDDDRRRG